MKLRKGASRYDGLLRIAGVLLMVGGTAAAFIIYEASISESDARNIASQQILAIGFLGLTLIGVALFIAASMARLLRFWLLRQLYEGQAHVDQLTAAIHRPIESTNSSEGQAPAAAAPTGTPSS